MGRYASIPLHIEYAGPTSNLIRPSASVSLVSPSYCAGVMMKINQRVFAGLEGTANFSKGAVVLIPKSLYGYFVNVNLRVELNK